MTRTTNDLKACPFCGYEAEIDTISQTQETKQDIWGVCCSNEQCFMLDGTTALFLSREEAIEAWNSRPALLTPSDSDVKEALEDIDEYIVDVQARGTMRTETLKTIRAAILGLVAENERLKAESSTADI